MDMSIKHEMPKIWLLNFILVKKPRKYGFECTLSVLMCLTIFRKRMDATEAVNHPFINLSNHRGLGDRIQLDKHRGYIFRRKWEVSESKAFVEIN